MRTSQVTPPTEEPVSLDEAKLHLKVEYTEDDTLITTLIGAARRLVETKIKASIITQTWDLYLNGWYDEQLTNYPGRYEAQQAIYMPRAPVQSVTSVQYLDSSGTLVTLDPTAYIVSPGSPGRITPAYGYYFPTTLPVIDSVIVRYVAGFGAATATPDNIKAALLLLIGQFYENRSAVGESKEELPIGVKALLGCSFSGWLT